MTDRWKLLKDVQWTASGGIEAKAEVPENSVWFKGHFPGEPILPGIALISTVYEAVLKDASRRGESLRISSLKRVRFTGPVHPGEKMTLILAREVQNGETLFRFKVTVRETPVCSGLMTVVKE
ncbi:MAG: hypothetical protein GX874_05210 [Smithella sp.]|nr:hypothetical protein [Smithellaceae bacterium]NLA40793.1 hypothetical protein [Smithella sp.]